MKPIQLVDLLGQYNKIKDEIDKAVLGVVGSSAYIMGPEMKQFETELANYLNAKHVIGCANGTDALQIALMALDLQPGDEVITPSFTYIATAEVIALLHLKSVFVDVDPETFTVTPEAIEKAISPNTKAIIPVHLYGQCADMEPILEIAKKHNLAVIEDTAQAIGAEYTFSDGSSRKAGTMGDFGCTSFFPSKNLGAFGDGGAIFTNNDELNKKVRMIANHGQKRKYYHDVIGVNSRLDSIQAAVLRIKLKHLDEYAAARNHAADFYDEKLANISDISVPKRSEKSTHVFHQYSLKLNGMERDAFQEELKAKGIPSNVYYPLPIHLQKGFEKADCRKEDLSVTEDLMQHVISLPIHTELTEDQLQYITDTVTEFAKKNVSVSQPV